MADFEIIDPRFAAMMLPNARLELLAQGFRWLEGPVWFADHQSLIFSDIPNNRIMRWCESAVTVFREPSQFANGHARDRQGRLISCHHQSRAVTRTEYNGDVTILADHYRGRRLNSPNDVIVKSDGSIWFSDPHYGINTDYEGGKQLAENPAALYRLDPDGALTIAADDFDGPNGLCFSPDERRLYVVESGIQFAADPKRVIRVFDMADDGITLTGKRAFYTVHAGMADGIRADDQGNIWSSAADGVHCIAPDGSLLGRIKTPNIVSNLAFGGRHLSRLFLCAGDTLLAIYTNVRGAAFS